MHLSPRFATLLAALLLVCLPLAFGQENSSRAQLAKNYGNLPLSFEANQGQTDPQVRFLSRGSGYSLFFTDSAAVPALTRNDPRPDPAGADRAAGGKPLPLNRTNKTDLVRMELAGTSHDLQVAGADPLPGKANYLIGNDPARWHRGVPTYGQVKYTGVYAGVDLAYHGNQRRLEYDFDNCGLWELHDIGILWANGNRIADRDNHHHGQRGWVAASDHAYRCRYSCIDD
jgi:hypothetical protein